MLDTFRFSLAVVGISVLAMAAPAQTTKPGTPPAGGAAAAKAAPPRSPVATPDPVLGTVNNEPIHQSEVTNLLDQFMIPPGSEDRAYTSAMDLLVNTKLLAQFLREQKITVGGPEVDEVVAQYEANFKQQGTDLATALAESGTSLPQFRDRIARSLQWKKFVEARATDAELQKYAEQNKDVFNNTLVRASHILVAVDPEATPEQKEQARQKLQAIKQQIDSKQISFADAANKFSEDPGNQAKPSGGDLNFFPRKGQFIEPFAAAAFAMQKGQISELVETEYGYHLIQVTDRNEGKPYDFEQMKPQILNQYAADLQEQIVTARKAKADIKIQPMPAGLVKTEEIPPEPVGGTPGAGTAPAGAPTPPPAAGSAPGAPAPKAAAPKAAAPRAATPPAGAAPKGAGPRP